MKKSIIIFTVLWLVLPLLSKTKLSDAIKNGLKLNEGLKKNYLELAESKIRIKSAKFSKIFSLSLNGDYRYVSDNMEIQFPESTPAPGIVIPAKSITAGALHNYDLNFSLIQPLYTGNVLSNQIKLLAIEELAGQNRIALGKVNTASKIKLSYFNFRLLEQRLNSVRIIKQQLQLHFKKLNHLFSEDLVRKSDLLETKIKIAELELKEKDFEYLATKEKMQFEHLCGFRIEEIEPFYSEKVSDYQTMLKNFFKLNPVLKILENRRTAADLQVRLVQGKYLPKISGFAEVHYGRPGIDFFKNEWQLYFQAGIVFKLKLFDWNRKERDQKLVEYRKNKTENEKQKIIRETKTVLKQLYEAKTTKEKKLKIVKQMVLITAEDTNQKKQLFENNQISNIDFLAALMNQEKYTAMFATISAELEIIKVNINKISGIYEEVQ